MDHAQITDDMDVQTLHALVARQLQMITEQALVITRHEQTISQHECTINRHERTITEREARISVLTAEIARLRRAQFTARSEKMDPGQRAVRGNPGGGYGRRGS